MSFENDILARLSKWYAEPNDPEAWEIDLMSEAVDVIMPLVKRAQADAWEAGVDATCAAYAIVRTRGYVTNPYIENEGAGT